MIDHFRTLLIYTSAIDGSLGVGYNAKNTHIDPTFSAPALPASLAAAYNLLFPSPLIGSKLLMAHAYMTLLKATGLEESMTVLDPRTTYKLMYDLSQHSTSSISVGVPQTASAKNATGSWLRPFNYAPPLDTLATRGATELTVRQVSGHPTQLEVVDASSNVWMAPTVVSFQSSVSSPLTVVDPVSSLKNKVFDFRVGFTGSFTATTDKAWSIYLTLPYTVLIEQIYNRVNSNRELIERALRNNKSSPDAESYDNLWRQHQNTNYRLAGLIVGLVYRLNHAAS